ncbi:MAG: hypothetical protein GC134_07595 [Proteobacteria bacterium]|nr:hypothetical protein [Pseudomonadota bacterium]
MKNLPLIALLAATALVPAAYAQQPRPYVHTFVGDPGNLPAEPVLDGNAKADPEKPLTRLSDDALKELAKNAPSEEELNNRAAFLEKAPKAVNVDELVADNSKVAQVTVDVDIEDKTQDPMSWTLSPLDIPVLLRKLAEKKEVYGKVSTVPSESGYAGVTLHMLSPKGRSYGPIHIYQNAVEIDGKPRFLQDHDRDLEFWIFGTARNYDARVRTINLLEIYTFGDCLKLGNTLVETAPRQCIIPDGTTFLESNEILTEKDKKINTFDRCLEAGNPLINSFPRKCIAPGGRLYVEPPRLKGDKDKG